MLVAPDQGASAFRVGLSKKNSEKSHKVVPFTKNLLYNTERKVKQCYNKGVDGYTRYNLLDHFYRQMI
jgi:hypothetical protein